MEDFNMANLNKEEQINVVKQAMELEQSIIDGDEKLSKLKRQSFKSAPDEPTRKTVEMNVQSVAPDYSALPKVNITMTEYLENEIKTAPNFLNKLMTAHPVKRGLIISVIASVAGIIIGSIAPFLWDLAFSLLGVGWAGIFLTIIYYFKKKSEYKNNIDEYKSNIESQPEYQHIKAEAEQKAQAQTEAIIEERKREQAEYDRQYEEEKDHYDTVIMPQYEKEKADWTSAHEVEVKAVYDKLQAYKTAQTVLYTSTKIIPMQYRDIHALSYLYQLMSTSDYDIKEAVHMYDNEIARQQAMQRIREQQKANDLAHEQIREQQRANEIADEQNYLLNEQNARLEEQNDISNRQLKHDRASDFVGTIQRHNTNKYLKGRK